MQLFNTLIGTYFIVSSSFINVGFYRRVDVDFSILNSESNDFMGSLVREEFCEAIPHEQKELWANLLNQYGNELRDLVNCSLRKPYNVTIGIQFCIPEQSVADVSGAAAEDGYVRSTRDICSICLNAMNIDSQTITTTICMHSYHQVCLGGWLVTGQSTCPYCRALL